MVGVYQVIKLLRRCLTAILFSDKARGTLYFDLICLGQMVLQLGHMVAFH